MVADDSSSGPTAEQLAAQGAKHGPSAPTATQLQQELRQLKRSVGISGHPRVTSAGLAAVPSGVPAAVRSIVDAANKIALLPYRDGGGHASFRDNAYDCSGLGLRTPWPRPAWSRSRWTRPPSCAGARRDAAST